MTDFHPKYKEETEGLIPSNEVARTESTRRSHGQVYLKIKYVVTDA